MYIETKDYYSYLCAACNNMTPYCFKCNKALDVLLESNFFKCFNCQKLAKVTNRETHYATKLQDEMFIKMFQSKEDAGILNTGGNLFNQIGLLNYKNDFQNSRSLNTCYGFNTSDTNTFNSNFLLQNNNKIYTFDNEPKTQKIYFEDYDLSDYSKYIFNLLL
jgi:hypothetical protein